MKKEHELPCCDSHLNHYCDSMLADIYTEIDCIAYIKTT